MLGLAAGDLGAEIPALGRADEIGQMARAVATFKEAALDRRRLEREAVDQRETNEAARRSHEDERAARAREQEQVVAIIARGHEQLSRGNLTHRIGEDFPPAYQKLKDDFNAAIAQLQRTLTVISAPTQEFAPTPAKSRKPRTIFPVAPSSRRPISRRPLRRSARSPRR